MKKTLVIIAVLVGLPLGGLVLYRMVELNRLMHLQQDQLAELDRDFLQLAKRLVDGNYRAAYDMAGSTLKDDADFKKFEGVWEELARLNGPLHKVEGRRRPVRGTLPLDMAVIDAEFFYRTGVLEVELVYGRHDEKWWLQGYHFPQKKGVPETSPKAARPPLSGLLLRPAIALLC